MEEEKKEVLEEEKTENAPISETSQEDENQETRKTKPLNKKFIAILTAVIIMVVLYGAYANGKLDKSLGITRASDLTIEEAENLINTNLMEGGENKITVTEVTEEKGVYKIKLIANEQEFTAYLTKDRKLFFPNVYDFDEIQKEKEAAEAEAKALEEQQLAGLAKTDKPVVELFVMSHCPYGTQMEKGIIPVVKALGDKIDFKLKFCDYAMHDKKEMDEQVNQYCISQNYPDKLIPYLECFLADETASAKCMAETGIDAAQISSCAAATDKKFNVTANYNNQASWKSETYPPFAIHQEDVARYGINGSPSLVINGQQVKTNRDSASLLKFVCAGFSNAPEECSQVLSSTAPSAGFGYAEGTNTNASCE